MWQNSEAMAKRMRTRFDRSVYPTYERVDENGYPQPCVLGHPWVNPDTLKTIRKRGGHRTDPKGRPLPEAALPERGDSQADAIERPTDPSGP
jgi:hypothetical protein